MSTAPEKMKSRSRNQDRRRSDLKAAPCDPLCPPPALSEVEGWLKLSADPKQVSPARRECASRSHPKSPAESASPPPPKESSHPPPSAAARAYEYAPRCQPPRPCRCSCPN